MITWWDARFMENKLTGILIKPVCVNDQVCLPNGLKLSVIMVLKVYSMSLWDYFNRWLDQEYIPTNVTYAAELIIKTDMD